MQVESDFFKRKENYSWKKKIRREEYALDCPGAAGRRDDEKAGHVVVHHKPGIFDPHIGSDILIILVIARQYRQLPQIVQRMH